MHHVVFRCLFVLLLVLGFYHPVWAGNYVVSASGLPSKTLSPTPDKVTFAASSSTTSLGQFSLQPVTISVGIAPPGSYSFSFAEDITINGEKKSVTFSGTMTVSGAGANQNHAFSFDLNPVVYSASRVKLTLVDKPFGNYQGSASFNFTAELASTESYDVGSIGAAGTPFCAKPGGCTTWSVSPSAISLALHDMPVGYRPAVGPAVEFHTYYAQRDLEQPATFNYGNLGPLWTTNWTSYVVDQLATSTNAKHFLRGGGSETYSFPSVDALASSVSPYSQAVLTRRVDGAGKTVGFVRTLKDGASEEFNQAVGNQFFLTAVVDRAGRRVTLGYDSSNRLVTIKDAAGQVTALKYQNSDALKITSVVDPFGRTATFFYNGSGQLSGITDTIGIASSFTYGAANFVTALKTPYGTTNFDYGDSSTDSKLGSTRFLKVTDALGRVSRYEFNDAAAGIAATEAVTPSGISVTNAELNRRNTYIWNPTQYAAATAAGGLDYGKARVIHWLKSVDGSAISRVIESTKEPLEGRVWYRYSGQPDASTVGSSNQPTQIGRVMGDGKTQLQTFQYNDAGNVVLSIDPVGRRMSYGYATNGIDLTTLTNTTSSNDVLAAITYNSQHQPLTIKGANGATTSFEYNSAGQPVRITDALGNVTIYSYDGTGNLTKRQSPVAESFFTFTYDAAGNVLTARDAVGGGVQYAYDAADRPVTATFNDKTQIAYTYNLLDLVTVTDRLGHKTTLTYDAERQLLQSTDALGNTVKLGYSPGGTLNSLTDPNGHATQWTLDLQDRVTAKTYADGTVHRIVYDAVSSRVASLTDALGQVTSPTYNIDDTLAAVAYAKAINATAGVSYAYDAAYRRAVSMTDGIGTTSYAYGAVGGLGANRLKGVTSPIAGGTGTDTVSYAYDALDRVISRVVNGSAETTSFDAIGRVTGISNALDKFAYGYSDGTGRVTSITSVSGPKVALEYFDANGDELLKSLTYTTVSGGTELSKFAYTYDANQNVKIFTESYLNQKFSAMAAAHGDGGTLRGILTAALQGSGVAAGAAGMGFVVRMPNEGELVGLLAILVMVLATRAIARQWPPLRRRRLWWPSVPVAATLMLSSCGGGGGGSGGGSGGGGGGGGNDGPKAQVTNYAYDDANRLISGTVGTDKVASSGNPMHSYAYDAASNLTSLTVNGGAKSLSYTATNSISSGTYDANGNPLDLDGSTYLWDAANRLIQVTKGKAVSIFSYDGEGRMVRIVDRQNGAVVGDRAYLWCGMQRCQERDSSKTGSPVSKQYFSQGIVANGGATYYVTDQLGSVRQLVDASGSVQAQYGFEPYGNRTKIGGSIDSDFGFAGMFNHAPSGQNLAVFRNYDSQQARWLNRDPIQEGGGINIFGYANGNPLKYTDRSGLTWLDAKGMFWEWANGTAPVLTTYGPGTNQSNDMMTSEGVVKALELYRSKNYANCDSERTALTNFSYSFGLRGLWVSGFNSTQQFVGSYSVDIYPVPNDMVSVHVRNTTSKWSFLYHAVPSSWNSPNGDWMGNASQEYIGRLPDPSRNIQHR